MLGEMVNREVIYKAVNSISGEEILGSLKYEDKVSITGDVMDYNIFIDCVDSLCIMDYDGIGCIVLDGRETSNAFISIIDRSIYIKDGYIIPWKVMYDIFGDRMKFIWYNR